MKGKSIFYQWPGHIFWLPAVAVTGYTWYHMDQTVPDWVSIIENEEEEFSFGLPLKATISSDSQEAVLANENNIPVDQITINGRDHLFMFGGEKGSYQVGPKPFGVIKLKDIQADVADTRYTVPCGSPMGIYLKSGGVMVIGTGHITGSDGMEVEPAYGVLKSGDYIEASNGKSTSTKEGLIRAVSKSGGQECVFQVRREGEDVDVSLKPVQGVDGQYKLGVWVRDDTQGIGTITYVDINGRFGALGYGTSDSDTKDLMESSEGVLYSAGIMGIEKGSMGKPGLLSGVIYYDPQSHMGNIEKNTNESVFSAINQQLKKQIPGEPMEIACRQDVKQGPAYIRNNVSGELKDYATEIRKMDYNSGCRNKSMVIKATDPELPEPAGGVAQGMSGSLTIQDGKLAGAMTHVFVQNASREYGILIENMLEQRVSEKMSGKIAL